MISLQAADFALRQGQTRAALYLQAELVSRARRATVTQFVNALANRGLTYAQAGQGARALEELRRAGQWVRYDNDPAAARRGRADIALFRGMVLAEREPARAVELLSEAAQVYDKTEHHLQALIAYRARAHAYRSLHDLDSAERDLLRGLEANDQLGEGISKEEEKLVFLDQATHLFDEMISFQAHDRERLDLAFMYADRARTRELGNSSAHLRLERADRRELLAAEPEPVRLDEVRAALPAGTSLVEYAVLADRVLIWLLRRDGLLFFERKVEPGDLARRVERCRDAIVNSKRATGATDLDSLLIQPWISRISKDERLIFVPDKALVALPFAALRDPRTGRYLIEDHNVSVAPSAAFYLQAHEARPRWPGQDFFSRALFVGNPAFDQKWFENLDDLPDAIEETKGLLGLYGSATGSRSLTGAEADKRRFLALAPQFSIVHYAGHTSYNAEHPLLSALVLAPDPEGGDLGALYAWEIYRMDLRRNWLVILSACGPEGQGAIAGAEGMSLPRAFLAAGSPNVVASLWNIEDSSSARFFARFHRELRNVGDPAQALRQTQLALLKSSNPRDRRPVVWAGFELFGSKPDRQHRIH
jgi:CHAT domain-containing protein